MNCKEGIKSNKFVDILRDGVFDDSEYSKLCIVLKQYKIETKKSQIIDKEIALYLYCIPQYTFNSFQAMNISNNKSVIVNKMEEAWIELDALVIEILSQD